MSSARGRKGFADPQRIVRRGSSNGAVPSIMSRPRPRPDRRPRPRVPWRGPTGCEATGLADRTSGNSTGERRHVACATRGHDRSPPVLPGTTSLVTRRCSERRCFLRPSPRSMRCSCTCWPLRRGATASKSTRSASCPTTFILSSATRSRAFLSSFATSTRWSHAPRMRPSVGSRDSGPPVRASAPSRRSRQTTSSRRPPTPWRTLSPQDSSRAARMARPLERTQPDRLRQAHRAPT